MPAPTIYRSTDASAPVLTGEVGKLVTLLDACLVNGYGSKAAAGWGKAYADTNYGAYRPASGNRAYLRVDDTDARMSRVVGYANMTSLLSGTDPFPTSVQFSGGLYCRKSVTANNTARPWILLASATAFYLIIYANQTTFGQYDGADANLGFGDFVSYLTGEASNSFIIAATDTSTTSTFATSTRQVLPQYGTAPAGHYMEQDYTGAGGSKTFGVRPMNFFAQSFSGATGAPYPDSVTGGIYIDKLLLLESNLSIRGELPGIWGLGQVYTSFANFDTFTGSSTAISGQEYLICLTGSYGVAFRTDGGW